MDRFMEQVVVKKQRGLNEVLYVLAMISMVLFAILGMMYLQMLFYAFSVPALVITVMLLGGAVLLFLYRDRLRAEYEYTFTNGDVDFAMVFNNQKRKSLGSLKGFPNEVTAGNDAYILSFIEIIDLSDFERLVLRGEVGN